MFNVNSPTGINSEALPVVAKVNSLLLDSKTKVALCPLVEEVSTKEADEYYNSRPYKNKIGAWASSQSEVLDKRETFFR